jgi:diadenosine tetraphosphate (Ap4A) HIT family hydrolase
MTPCFFCEVQKKKDPKQIASNRYFFSRYDDFSVSNGHAEIVPKRHVYSVFELTTEEWTHAFEILDATKRAIERRYKPDGYNIGINEGNAGGQSIGHLHIHLIPRYIGDIANPEGGIRNIIPGKGKYTTKAKGIKSRKNFE